LVKYSQTILHSDHKRDAVYRLIRLLAQTERDKHQPASSKNEFEKILHMKLMMSVSNAESQVFMQYLHSQEIADTRVEG